MSKQRKKSRNRSVVINLEVHQVLGITKHFGDSGFILPVRQCDKDGRDVTVRLHLDVTQIEDFMFQFRDQLKHEHDKLQQTFKIVRDTGVVPANKP